MEAHVHKFFNTPIYVEQIGIYMFATKLHLTFYKNNVDRLSELHRKIEHKEKEKREEEAKIRDLLNRVLQESISLLEEPINVDLKIKHSKSSLFASTTLKNGRWHMSVYLDKNKIVDPYYESKVKGVLQHEVAHIIFTPYRLYQIVTKGLWYEFPEIDIGEIDVVVNAVEDYRVESLFKKAFPESKVNFSALHTEELENFAKQFNPNSIRHLLFLALVSCSTTINHPKIAELEQQIPTELKNLYKEFIDCIKKTAGKEFESTETAAREILEKIRKENIKSLAR